MAFGALIWLSIILKGHGQPGNPGFDQAAGQPSSAAMLTPAGAGTALHQPAGQP
jgi:hypothetical protein